VDAIHALVRLGCEASVQDNVASTPLHVAAGEGHLAAIATLVQLVRVARMCSHVLACARICMHVYACEQPCWLTL
jgi:hypothetical protein